MNVNAANDVYIRSERDRSSTEAPIARISSAASRAETAWTFSPRVESTGWRPRLNDGVAGRAARGLGRVARRAEVAPALAGQAGFGSGWRAMDDALAGRLSRLPAVHVLADAAAATPACDAPRWAVVEAARRAIAGRREAILGGDPRDPADPASIRRSIRARSRRTRRGWRAPRCAA